MAVSYVVGPPLTSFVYFLLKIHCLPGSTGYNANSFIDCERRE